MSGQPSKTWMAQAACRDCPQDDHDDAFSVGVDRQQAFAYRYCARCPVIAECAEYADATRQREGVWGGQTEVQRAAARRRVIRNRQENRHAAATTAPTV